MDREVLFGLMERGGASPPVVCKSVFNPAVARELLRRGHRIVDIKPRKEDRGRTVFLFEKTDGFLLDLGALLGRSLTI